MSDTFLIKKIAIGFLISVVCIICIIRMCNGKGVIDNKNVLFKTVTIKIIYKYIIPFFIMSGIIFILIFPTLDFLDNNKYSYTDVGVLSGISSNNNPRSSFLGEYTIKLNGNSYRVPERLKSYSDLQKGSIYQVHYYKYSRLVYQIYLIR